MKNRHLLAAILAAGTLTSVSHATVYISEVFINPSGSGSFDDTYEFIELAGTPGKKLDGYAVAFLSGNLLKFYPLGSIPPAPIPDPEINEFFSLDGLTIGQNGILVLCISAAGNFPTIVSDSAVRPSWVANPIWNGLLDLPGNLENDGSNTILLIRNRPGRTQANPTHPAGLRWGKDIKCDAQLITPAIDPQDGLMYDQYGDGNIDKGEANGLGGFTLDLKGASTPMDISDDLEIVDEISYEHERGWEYQQDDRNVDVGSTTQPYPERDVRALDDPQSINPDCLVRVDYRTKGPGWPPAPGAMGQLPNGNNWQDTATEQWVRGESARANSGFGGFAGITFWFSNLPNTDPEATQPFETHVPRWLFDGTAPDVSYATFGTGTSTFMNFLISAGRTNPLAVPFIPGDTDRDGDCDAEDITKLANVFGDNDWIFSNSFEMAPESDSGDPAAQTRPWDVDATGDNGIEPSDLQWTLNFQGNSTGRVVGRTYDSATPTPAGGGNVHLNSNAGTAVTISTNLVLPPGRTASTIQVGDAVTIEVLAQVTGGANLSPAQENGVMQHVHDFALSTGGVFQLAGVLDGLHTTTRSMIRVPQGVSGDLGVRRLNGHSTSPMIGLSSPGVLYSIQLTATGIGSVTPALSASAEAKFAASTPRGVKIGRTQSNGNPASAAYTPMPMLTVIATPACPGDANGDGQVGLADIAVVTSNWTLSVPPAPAAADLDGNGVIGLGDIAIITSNWATVCP